MTVKDPNELPDLQKAIADAIGIIIGFALGMLMCSMITSCTRTMYVTDYRTDTLRIVDHKRDSIHVLDSVYLYEYVSGDTMVRIKDRWHVTYQDRLVHDTVVQKHVEYRDRILPQETKKQPWYSSVYLRISTVLTLLLLLVLWFVWVRNRKTYFRSRSEGGADE